jgi:hypothetical protein
VVRLFEVVVMSEWTDQSWMEDHSGFPAEITQEQYEVAVARARAYLRSARELRERARVAEEVATARLRSAERTLRVARQVLARLQRLGRRFDTN